MAEQSSGGNAPPSPPSQDRTGAQHAPSVAPERQTTRVDGMLDKFRNHRVVSVLIVGATAIIGAGAVTVALTGKEIVPLLTGAQAASVTATAFGPYSLDFVMPEHVDTLPPPDAQNCTDEALPLWAEEHGGVPANVAAGHVLFEAKGDGTSVLTVESIQVTKSETTVRRSGTAVVCPIGGFYDMIVADIDLEAEGPGVTFSSAEGTMQRPPSYTLQSGEQDSLSFWVKTNDSSFAWEAVLNYRVNGERHQIPLVSGEQLLAGLGDEGSPRRAGTLTWNGEGWTSIGG